MIPDNPMEVKKRVYLSQARAIQFIHSKEKARNRRIPSSIKLEMPELAGTKCPLCPNILTHSPEKKRQKIQDETEVSPDHIHDLVLGGQNVHDNFMLMCNQCNWSKNYAMQKYLTVPGEKGSPSSDTDWRKRLVSDPQNISKLMEYIEWSHRISENYKGSLFPDLYRHFNEKRFAISEKSNSTPSPKKKISWHERLFRFIGGLLWRKSRRSENLTESSEFPNLDFTPAEFSKGLLNQKKRAQPVHFTTLYDRLIKENTKFNLKQQGIKPNYYLLKECSDFLSIIERPGSSVPPIIHYWITEKSEAQRKVVPDLNIDTHKLIENTRERAAKDAKKQIDAELDRIARTNTHAKEKDTPKPPNGLPPSSIRQGIPGFSSANKSIKFPRDPEHLLILVGNFSRPNPDSLSYRELLTKSRTTLGKSMPGGSDLRLWMSLQNMRRQGEDDIIHVSYSNSSPEEIISELHQYVRDYMIPEFPYEVNTESVDAYFHSIGSTFKT